MKHRTADELEAGLDHIRESPADGGIIEMMSRRPQIGERELLEEAEIEPGVGVVGDNWSTRGSSKTDDGSSHPDMQITIMNARVIALVAGERERWILAGDQFFVDLDLSAENLPPGTLLTFGSAMLEVTAMPHNGCRKFVERFGMDAMKLISSELGRQLHLRGINARVHDDGVVRVGEVVRKVARD